MFQHCMSFQDNSLLIYLIVNTVGKPIPVERTGNPTEVQVNELHAKYIDELVALFERHKHNYYPNSENIKLQIL